LSVPTVGSVVASGVLRALAARHKREALLRLPHSRCSLAFVDSSAPITAIQKAPEEITISVRLVVNALAHCAQAAPLCSVHRTGPSPLVEDGASLGVEIVWCGPLRRELGERRLRRVQALRRVGLRLRDGWRSGGAARATAELSSRGLRTPRRGDAQERGSAPAPSARIPPGNPQMAAGWVFRGLGH
jgi:hypothetical protein